MHLLWSDKPLSVQSFSLTPVEQAVEKDLHATMSRAISPFSIPVVFRGFQPFGTATHYSNPL